jgi:hypothetical protein
MFPIFNSVGVILHRAASFEVATQRRNAISAIAIKLFTRSEIREFKEGGRKKAVRRGGHDQGGKKGEVRRQRRGRRGSKREKKGIKTQNDKGRRRGGEKEKEEQQTLTGRVGSEKENEGSKEGKGGRKGR